MFKITEGPSARPQRLLIYGPEGIGKSTFASQMPDPVFIDVEDGTSHMFVKRLEQPRDWGTLLAEIAYLIREPSGASTIVVDTADAAERLCQAFVCSQRGKSNIEDFGYGKGYIYARDEYQKMLDDLDRVIAAGMNVVLVAHGTMRKFERPDESGAYDRFELKLNKHVSQLVKEWADAVLFCDWETFVSVDDSGKAKASGGRRIIRTDHSPVWDAKNRWGLPETVPLDADGIALVRKNLVVRDAKEPQQKGPEPKAQPDPAQAVPEAPKRGLEDIKAEAERRKRMPVRFDPLLKLMAADAVTIEELETIMALKGKREQGQPIESWEKGFVDWTCAQWKSVVKLVKELRDTRKVAEAVDTPF